LTTLATLLQGRLLADRYRIGEALGFGGMGAVFRAHDERLGRDVAVKVLTAASADPAEQEVLRARFRREARAAATLRHPNVVTVHDFGTDPGSGLDFLVMERLPGKDVAERIAAANGPMSTDEALEIVREAAMGLAAGHRVGIVHRDVKPRNLFLVADPVGGWEVKVLDFGIAQLSAGEQPETRITQLSPSPYTPRYAAPEQLAASPHLTPACDVYALGIVALEMLTGRYPEGINSAADDAVAARAVDALRPRVAVPMCDALLRMLRRDPLQRPADADAVLRLLAIVPPAPPALDAAPTLAYPPTPPVPSPPVVSPIPQPVVPPPIPVHAYAPQPHAPQPAYSVPAPPAYAQPAPPQEAENGERRGTPLAKWIGIAVLVTLAGVYWTRDGEPPAAPEPAPVSAPVQPDPPPIPPEEAAARELASQEALRAVRLRGGIGFNEQLWIIAAATRAPDEVERAVTLRDRIAAAGHPAGLANGRVYPELPGDSVVVLAGPFDRGRAEAALPAIRRIARGARLRQVTFQMPR
jgi:serine/threonine protein kinase